MNIVSIIVPIYNVEKYLSKCLDSLINQTYKNIKIYAVIDGSPDNSINIVKEYSKKDNRIILIEKENGGYGSVLEETIKVIDTEYFMICDPDDWLDKNAVKTLITSANKYNLDIITGDKYNVYVDGDTTVDKANRYCDYIKPNKVYNNPRIFSLLCPSPHSKLYKTSLVKDINFPKKVNFTDFLLYMVIIAKSKKGMYIDKPFSYYLIDRIGNTSTDKSKKTYISWITVLNSSLNQINNDPYLYIRLYEQYRYTLIESFSNLSRKEKKELKKELKFIFKLKRYKKDIIKHLKNTNTKKSVWVCRLLFSRIFNYFTVLLLCRKISRVQLKKM